MKPNQGAHTRNPRPNWRSGATQDPKGGGKGRIRSSGIQGMGVIWRRETPWRFTRHVVLRVLQILVPGGNTQWYPWQPQDPTSAT